MPSLSFELSFDALSFAGEVDLAPVSQWFSSLQDKNEASRERDGKPSQAVAIAACRCGAQAHQLYWIHDERFCRLCGRKVQDR